VYSLFLIVGENILNFEKKDCMQMKNNQVGKTVAANIRKVRETKNFTQDYLAAKLGISQNAYSKIELGYSKITINRLIEIAVILEVEVRTLLDQGGSQ
jgi:DNA-binding XRE family transcriptional regulator